MNKTVKTRFSPSPTGLMHLGNTRTALFSFLLGLHHKGIFLLRIEDTDEVRSKEEFTATLQEDLMWLGLAWQEGPGKDLGHGPYWQSLRNEIYQKYYQQLKDQGQAYPCFCSEEQLAISRKIQLSRGLPPRYSGTCRSLSADEIETKIQQGQKPTLRFRVPAKQEINFLDFVKGPQRFLSDDIGDFIIQRGDKSPAFFFCNAIDDALMQVTHVMRGEDHLTNTPRQLMILEALGLAKPEYGHISLIVGHDGSKLSKRHGSKSVHELRQEGYLPIAMVNYLSRLGHYYEQNELLSLEDLARLFTTENLSKSPARFDPEQLSFWQKQAVLALTPQQLWQWMGIEVHSRVPVEQKDLFLETIQGNVLFPKDALHWAQQIFDEKPEYKPEHLAILTQAGKAYFEAMSSAVSKHGANYQAICADLQQTLGIKGKSLFMPMRILLTNEEHGPELVKVTALLGQEFLLKRLAHVIKILG